MPRSRSKVTHVGVLDDAMRHLELGPRRTPPRRLTDLPEELLMHIFSYRSLVVLRPITPRNHPSHSIRLLSVALTCEKFRRTAMEVYYSHNVFLLSYSSARAGYPPAYFVHPAPGVSHLVRKVELHLKVDDPYFRQDAMTALFEADKTWKFLLHPKRPDNHDHRRTRWQATFTQLKDIQINISVGAWRCIDSGSRHVFADLWKHATIGLRAKKVTVVVTGFNCEQENNWKRRGKCGGFCDGMCPLFVEGVIGGMMTGSEYAWSFDPSSRSDRTLVDRHGVLCIDSI